MNKYKGYFMNYYSNVIPAMIAFLLLTGCSTMPEIPAMVPHDISSLTRISDKTLEVAEVIGGEKTDSMQFSKIENEGFRQALIETMNKSNLFREIQIDQVGYEGYKLEAEILSQELKPGFEMIATVFVRYKLTDTKEGKTVWSENILSQHIPLFSEAFLGPVRARKANEGAVRDNLTQLVKKLSEILAHTSLNQIKK